MSPIEGVVPNLVEISTQSNSTKQNRSRDLFGVQLEVRKQLKVYSSHIEYYLN